MQKSSWNVEHARRMALAKAIIHEANPAAHLASAQAFIRTLDDRFRAALSHHLGCRDRTGVLDHIHDPAFLSRSMILRLCGFGWNPYAPPSAALPQSPERERSAVQVEKCPLGRIRKPPVEKAKRHRAHNVGAVEQRE